MQPAVFALGWLAMTALSGGAPGWAQESPGKKSEPSAATLAAGQQVFGTICASCHGLDGKGGERGPDIASRADVARLGDEELLKILRNGIADKGMPAFAGLGTAKLNGVLAYLRSLQGKGSVTTVSGDAAKGKELFFGKAECASCHMVNGRGGFLGPELSHYGQSHKAADIRAAIVNPKASVEGRYRGAEVSTKDGKTLAGALRNEDNFSLQLQTADGDFHFFSKTELSAIRYREESLMPGDYGKKLDGAEIDALVAYLQQSALGKAKR
ncbi:MAG TPA: c-type cytochrome [Dongiaceae bacterium]|nr:c-type cytochrome [Dongiaceae bacterium]